MSQSVCCVLISWLSVTTHESRYQNTTIMAAISVVWLCGSCIITSGLFWKVDRSHESTHDSPPTSANPLDFVLHLWRRHTTMSHNPNYAVSPSGEYESPQFRYISVAHFRGGGAFLRIQPSSVNVIKLRPQLTGPHFQFWEIDWPRLKEMHPKFNKLYWTISVNTD